MGALASDVPCLRRSERHSKRTCAEIATDVFELVVFVEHPEAKRAAGRVQSEDVVETAERSGAHETSVQEARAVVFDVTVLGPLYFMQLHFMSL